MERALVPQERSPREGQRADRRGEGRLEKVSRSSYLVPYFVTGYGILGLHSITKPRSVVEHH